MVEELTSIVKQLNEVQRGSHVTLWGGCIQEGVWYAEY